jgi:hypothetical protein
LAEKESDQGLVIPRGNVIRRNIIHDVFDGLAVCPGTDPGRGKTSEVDVYENLIYNAGDDGMESEGMCSNVRIWNNTFRETLTGIAVAPARIGPVYAIRNLMYGLGAPGSGGATAFKFQNEFPGSGPMYLFHNTADPVLGGRGIYIAEPVTWPLLVAQNNVWIGNDARALEYDADDPMDFDYDALWRTAPPGWSLVRWNGVKYWSLTDFCAATGQECHGLNALPRFADAAADDYTLDPTSQLIDAGLHIPAWFILSVEAP